MCGLAVLALLPQMDYSRLGIYQVIGRSTSAYIKGWLLSAALASLPWVYCQPWVTTTTSCWLTTNHYGFQQRWKTYLAFTLSSWQEIPLSMPPQEDHTKRPWETRTHWPSGIWLSQSIITNYYRKFITTSWLFSSRTMDYPLQFIIIGGIKAGLVGPCSIVAQIFVPMSSMWAHILFHHPSYRGMAILCHPI